MQATVKGGERVTAYQAFLAPVYRNRPNLKFMKNSHVTKVLFSGTTARGVNVKTGLDDCPNIVISATKEVILSAGGQGSPKILLQSGIGKSSDLPHGVKQVVNLPVGENYQDHVASIHVMKINPNARTQSLLGLALDIEKYYFARTRSFAEFRINAAAFIHTTDSNATYPEVQVIAYRCRREQAELGSVLAIFGFKDEFIARLVEVNKKYELFIVYLILLNPKSRGIIKLHGSDPDLPPKIIPNFLSHPDDVKTMLRGISKVQALVNTNTLRANSAELVKFDLPECNELPHPSETYWKW